MSCLSVIFFLWELEASTIPITVNYCLIHTFASLPRTSILPTLVQVRMNLTFNNMYGPLRTHMVNSCHKRPSTLVDQSNKWVGAENINPNFINNLTTMCGRRNNHRSISSIFGAWTR